MCEYLLEEVQGAATRVFPTPLFQDTWLHVHSCVWSAMLHTSETKPNLHHLQQNDRAMIRQICNVKPQDIVTTRSNELLAGLGIEDLDIVLKERGSAGMDMWNAPMVQSRQPSTYWLIESVGLGGPRWHWAADRGIAESGSSRLSTLMIDIPGDLMWDLPCLQQDSCLEGDPLMWMLPLFLHINQKSDDDDEEEEDDVLRECKYWSINNITSQKITLVLLNPDMPCHCKQKPTDLVLHSLSFNMWIWINNVDQVIWLTEN